MVAIDIGENIRYAIGNIIQMNPQLTPYILGFIGIIVILVFIVWVIIKLREPSKNQLKVKTRGGIKDSPMMAGDGSQIIYKANDGEERSKNQER